MLFSVRKQHFQSFLHSVYIYLSLLFNSYQTFGFSLHRLKSGATAVIALIQDKNLTIAWLGDSQVVLCKDGDAVQLMEPHKPDRQVWRCSYTPIC